jgi:hypothetical protein
VEPGNVTSTRKAQSDNGPQFKSITRKETKAKDPYARIQDKDIPPNAMGQSGINTLKRQQVALCKSMRF